MSNTLEYILSLKDEMSGKLAAIGINSGQALNKFAALERQQMQVKTSMETFGGSLGSLREKLALLRNEREWIPASQRENISRYTQEIKKLEGEIGRLEHAEADAGKGIGAMGVAFGSFVGGLAMRGFSMIQEGFQAGIEKAHEMHMAEVQLQNTMQNMGKYSQEGFEEVVNQSKELAKHTNYSSAEIISLQSQLRLVGSVGEQSLNRMTQASLDLSTKLGIGAQESATMLAKAVNNPEMLRMLSQRIMIDPAVKNHIQELAKDGKNAAAQMALLAEVEKRVGGAADAAFKADPMAQFQKAIGTLEKSLGGIGLSLLQSLQPVIDTFAEQIPKLLDALKPLFTELTKLPIGDIIKLILQIAQPILKIVVPAVHILVGLFNQAWAALQPGIQALMPLLNAVAFVIQIIVNIVGRLEASMTSHLSPIINVFIRVLSGTLTPVLIIVGKILGWVGDLLSPLFDDFMKLFDAVSWVYNKIADFFGWLGDKLGLPSNAAGESTGDNFIDGFNTSMNGWDPAGAIADKMQSAPVAGVYRMAAINNAGIYQQTFDDVLKSNAYTLDGILHPENQFIIPKANVPGKNSVDTRYNAGGGDGNDDDDKKSNEAVATGGQKNVTVNMTIAHMFEDFKIERMSVQESAKAAHDMVIDSMTRAVAMGASMGGS